MSYHICIPGIELLIHTCILYHVSWHTVQQVNDSSITKYQYLVLKYYTGVLGVLSTMYACLVHSFPRVWWSICIEQGTWCAYHSALNTIANANFRCVYVISRWREMKEAIFSACIRVLQSSGWCAYRPPRVIDPFYSGSNSWMKKRSPRSLRVMMLDIAAEPDRWFRAITFAWQLCLLWRCYNLKHQ